MFGDSSQDIFSAVAFLRARATTPTGKVKTELVFVLGKARVAPMKVMTVPKLELQAALLAARLKREIKKFVKRSSRIAPHSPFISPNGLIRSSGRIKRLIEVGLT